MNAPGNVEWRTVIRFAEDEVLRRLLRALDIDAYIEIRHREEATILSLEHGAEPGRLIGRDGHTLAAIQHLVNLLVAKRFGPTRTILIDCAGYRERHKSNLHRVAKEAGRRAQRTGKPVTLEPMIAADRRIVHTALREWPGIETTSVDEDAEAGTKRVQISPVGRLPGLQGVADDEETSAPFAAEEDEEDEPVEPFPPMGEDDEDAPPKSAFPVEE